jgi:hypothetical protein
VRAAFPKGIQNEKAVADSTEDQGQKGLKEEEEQRENKRR